jgi:organic radical activating enzyme
MTPKDMLTNTQFCPMPWTGLMYNFDGTVKNCIRSSTPLGNIQEQTIEQILTGDTNANRQSQIQQQQPVDSCRPCKDIEQNKRGFEIISDRVFYIRELKRTDPTIYDQTGYHNLQSIDVRWTNLCNFACVYCTPIFSSRWADELDVNIQQPDLDKFEQFKKYIFDHADNLKHVYLAGGEPLLMKQNLELLDLLLEKNPGVNLRVNTNLSKTNTQVFDRICEFQNVHWTISVESMDQEFNYIRFGGEWQDFLDNLQRIQDLGHKISFNMLWFLLNYNSVFDCVAFLRKQGFHPNSFVIGALLTPEYLNIRHLPKSVLQLLEHKLEHLISNKPGYLLEDSYRNMLYYIQQPFAKDLNSSFAKLATMDQRRGVDSSKIFKELYKLKEGN